MAKYKAVLFDFDGTLMDSIGIWREINRNFFDRLSIPYHREELDFSGLGYRECALYVKEKFDIREDIESIMSEWSEEAIKAYRQKNYLKPYAGEFIKSLYDNDFTLGIGTSNTRDIVIAALDAYSLTGYFKKILTSCEVERSKPYPDVYMQLKDHLGYDSSECVVFEDTIEGIRAAKSAGMYCYAVYEPAHEYEKEDVLRYCDCYIDGFAYFKDNLTNLHDFL